MTPKPSTLLSDAEVEDLCRSHYVRVQPAHPIQRLQLCGWDLQSSGDTPSGFLSQQKRLRVRCRIEDSVEEQTLQFFLKTTTTGSRAQAAYVTEMGAFRKESQLFARLIPSLCEAGGSEFAPHCYLSRDHSLIVFEDLESLGFRNAAGNDGLLDLPHLLLTVESLAAMHAFGWLFERQKNQSLLNTFAHQLDENAYPDRLTGSPARHAWVATTIAALCALLAEMPQYQGRSAELSCQLGACIRRIYKLSQPSARFRNCFGHGDLWKNNVMFKYAELAELGETTVLPVEAKFVDFQLARYAPPALDLMTICMMVTSSDFRATHLERVLNAYYAQLEAVLWQNGLSVAVELPRGEFQESCKQYAVAGLIESCLFSHMTLLPRRMAESVVGDGFEAFAGKERVETCVRAFREDEGYRKRMSDMIGALVEDYVVRDVGKGEK